MAARTVAVRLTAEVGSYIAGMKNAAAATQDLTTKTLNHAEKNKQAFTQVGVGVAAIGALAATGVAAAVGKFAEFDAAMSGVQAATHESAAAMGSLRDAALEAGARTAFSATEAAEGIEALAKAGVSTQAILNGGLNGALDLAAAGSLGVGEAAEIAATALTQFKLQGSAVPHVADLLAAAAGKAQGEVSDMGQALKQSGLVAAQTGLSIEETTAALASFASAGLLGSDAGTSLKTMLQRLTPTSSEAADMMKALGFSAYDAQGNFIGLQALADEMQTSFSGLTVEQRNLAMATVFGSDAVRAASVLYEQGASGISDWTDKVNDAGFAQETAAIKLDNLKGDFEAFTGSLETALIKSGSAGDGIARGAVQAATAVVNAYSEMPAPLQAAVTGMGAVTAALGLTAGGALILVPRIAAMRTALIELGVSARVTSAAVGTLKWGAIGAGAAGAVVGVDLLARAMADAAPSANAFRDSMADFAAGAGVGGAVAEAFGSDLHGLTEILDRAGQSRWFSLDWGTTTSDIIEAQDAVTNIDEALAGLTSGGHADVAKKQFDALAVAAMAQGKSVDWLRKQFPQYADALRGVAADTKLAGDGQQGLASGLDISSEAMKAAEEATKAAAEALKNLADADAAFVNPLGAFKTAMDAAEEVSKASAEKSAATFNESVDAKIKAAGREYDVRLKVARDTKGISDKAIQTIEDERDRTIDALGKQKKSWEDYAKGVKVSIKDYLDELQAQVEAQRDWERNMLILAGRVSGGVLNELKDMGEEGAPLVAALVNATDAELARMEPLAAQRGAAATTAFADGLTRAQPVLEEVARIAGRKTATALGQKLADGQTTVAAIMRRYGLVIEGGVESPIKRSEAATDRLIRKLSDLDGRRVEITVVEKTVRDAQRDGVGSGITARATGGSFAAGPLLVGERGPELLFPDAGGYVLNNRATLEALNASNRFADGGWVSGRSGGASAGSAGPTHNKSVSLTVNGNPEPDTMLKAKHAMRDMSFEVFG